MLSLIAACSQNYVIGNNGKVPWTIHEDSAFFKETVEGKTVICGRKTFITSTWLSKKSKVMLITKNRFLSIPNVNIFYNIKTFLLSFFCIIISNYTITLYIFFQPFIT